MKGRAGSSTVLMILAGGLATPAAALDLSSLALVYDETYVGETAYPTAPELDDAGLGGLSGGSFAVGAFPTLTGSTAHLAIASEFGGEPDLIGFTRPAAPGTLEFSSLAFRGDFANLSFVDGVAVCIVLADFSASNLQAFVAVADAANATLTVVENPKGGVENEIASVSLPAPMAAAVAAGSAFTIDLLIDRDSGTATASVTVPGVGTLVAGPGAFTVPKPDDPLLQLLQMGRLYLPAATGLLDLDFTRFRVYEAPGNVVGWGDNSSLQIAPPLDLVVGGGGAGRIAAGVNHGCAIEAAGNVVCWGTDLGFGELNPPDAVNGVGGTASAISAYGSYTCAIQAGTGNVVCWGENLFGQSSPPNPVNGTTGSASEIAAGLVHTCAIQAGTGEAVCWGDNAQGQALPPLAVNGVGGTASDIAVGAFHSCAVQTGTGIVVCWGFNQDGQTSVPPSVNGVGGTAVDVAAGGTTSCAIQAGTGAVVCWGLGSMGQTNVPNSVNGVGGAASAIAVGDVHACALQAGSGNVVCWGANFAGQTTPSPLVDGTSGTASAIVAGASHNLAIVAEPPPGLTVYVTYSTESIVSGPLSLGLSALPTSVYATIHLPAFDSRENVVAGLAHVGSFALVLGDALSTELATFSLMTDATGEVTTLTYTTLPIDTATATNLVASNSSFSATIQGTDTASGLTFEYDYATSAQRLAVVPGLPPVSVPGLSTWGMAAVVLALAGGSLVAFRRPRLRRGCAPRGP